MKINIKNTNTMDKNKAKKHNCLYNFHFCSTIESNRNATVDIIRIIAVCLIVLVHAVENSGLSDTAPRIVYLLIYAFSRIGVPLFFMISGWLLLTKKYDPESTKRFYLKNVLPLIIC